MILIILIIQVDLFMLDDSWFWLDQFYPPDLLIHMDTLSSFSRNYTRTVGAYLISQHTARKLAFGDYFYPQRLPIDLQMNYAIAKERLSTHWAFPPVTCAGSAGMNETSSTGGYSIYPEFRQNCKACCNKFFDVSDMRPYLTLLPLTAPLKEFSPSSGSSSSTIVTAADLDSTDTKIAQVLQNYEGKPVKSTFGGANGAIFLVEKGKLRVVPNMDTFYVLKLKMKEITYLTDDIIENAPRGDPIPPCTNC